MSSDSSFGWPMPEAHDMPLAERMAAMEVAQDMTTNRADERMQVVMAQQTEFERRFIHGRERMDGLEDHIQALDRAVSPLHSLPAIVERLHRDLSPLPSRVKSLERKLDNLGSNFVKYRNGGLYFIGMLMLSLVLSGKMTIDQFWKIVLALGKQLL